MALCLCCRLSRLATELFVVVVGGMDNCVLYACMRQPPICCVVLAEKILERQREKGAAMAVCGRMDIRVYVYGCVSVYGFMVWGAGGVVCDHCGLVIYLTNHPYTPYTHLDPSACFCRMLVTITASKLVFACRTQW